MSAQNRVRYFWVLLVLGIAVRCLALYQPLVDAHLIRQCQTAAATQNLLQQPGLGLSTPLPWAGDSDARYVLEVPVYNYLVIGVYGLIGNLDLSGKLVTILLWAASFFVLQTLWRRMLDERQTFWANVLFVLAPLEIFYGQAFMPEMLVQLLAFAFVAQIARYDEKPEIGRWIGVAGIGLLAVVVKLPAVAHLYLILAALLWRRAGWKEMFRPRYLIAAVITAGVLKAWTGVLDTTNTDPLAFGSSKENLRVFVGTLSERFQFKPWAMICLYVGTLVLPGPALFAAGYGFWRICKDRLSVPLLKLWLLSLIAFYLIWFGNGATKQSYYNLAAVAPLSALGGIGAAAFLEWKRVAQWRVAAIAVAGVLMIASVVPICRYLFSADRQILAASRWTREHTRPEDISIFRVQHRWDMINYDCNPVPAYLSNRRAFIWTSNTSESVKLAHLGKAETVVITLPPPSPTGMAAMFQKFRNVSDPIGENWDWLADRGFREVAREPEFVAWQKKDSIKPGAQ